DEALAGAAKNALAKIATASPDDLRDRLDTTRVWAAQQSWSADKEPLLRVGGETLRGAKNLHIQHVGRRGKAHRRPRRPVTLGYYENKQIIGAWCVLRQDFRNFRVDRIRAASEGPEPFGKRRVILMKEWEAIWRGRVQRTGDDAGSSS